MKQLLLFPQGHMILKIAMLLYHQLQAPTQEVNDSYLPLRLVVKLFHRNR